MRSFSNSNSDNEYNQNLVVVIAGPTGVGKSDVAARLCYGKGMIVSADSVQAYRGVQIGANKPTAEEMEETPHMLVDLVDAHENYNVAEWRNDALFVIQNLLQQPVQNDCDDAEVLQRQDVIQASMDKARLAKGYMDQPVLPVVVGGTMMYLKWLVDGRPDAMRPTDGAVQKAKMALSRYQQQEGEDGDWEAAVEYVSSLGPTFATRLQQFSGNDWYRLRRTLEIAYTVQENGDTTLIDTLYSGEREGGLESFGYDVRCFFLCPDDRMQHTEIVDRRCEDMILRGLLQETADLQVSGNLPEMAARAIGYRQTLDYLHRENASKEDGDALEAFLNDFSTATRRYAKKQMQWFRKEEKFAFIPVSLSDSKTERVQATVETIQRMCLLTRADYERELLPIVEDGSVPISAHTKKVNEEQGKTMKFYLSKRYLIQRGTRQFDDVLDQADERTSLVQGLKVLDIGPATKMAL